MVRVIMGAKGSGKTKQLIEMINRAASNENGIDSLCKIIPSEPDSAEVEEFLAWLDRFSDANGVKFTITISADIALATEAIKAYF